MLKQPYFSYGFVNNQLLHIFPMKENKVQVIESTLGERENYKQRWLEHLM